MGQPLINILTRTSNRPKFFKRCVESVLSQTYKNIKHIVSFDDDKDLSYINNYEHLFLVKIDKDWLIKTDTSKNPNTGKYSPHNLYFNVMFKTIEDGWVIILDDDNFFTENTSLEKISKFLDDEESLVLWQINHINHGKIPNKNLLGKPPIIGNIDSGCFSFNIKILGDLKWDGWKCGDFRFIKNLYNRVDKKVLIPETFITIDSVGFGNRGDK
jgi:cellulose synthase/poly-beta-1,6-N-acetylglucosamine synthase-like glycosyltransferase